MNKTIKDDVNKSFRDKKERNSNVGGKNKGYLLKRNLHAKPRKVGPRIYMDQNSSDGSQEDDESDECVSQGTIRSKHLDDNALMGSFSKPAYVEKSRVGTFDLHKN